MDAAWNAALTRLTPRMRVLQRAWQEKADADVRIRLLTGFAGGLMIGKVVNRVGR